MGDGCAEYGSGSQCGGNYLGAKGDGNEKGAVSRNATEHF